MKYELAKTGRFKKDLKKLILQGKDLSKLNNIVDMLLDDIELPKSNRDHELTGNYKGYRECHVEPDLLLIYKKDKKYLILTLTRTGSHSELLS